MEIFLKKTIGSLVLALALLLQFVVPAFAAADSRVAPDVSKTVSYIYDLVKSPQVGSIGGGWVCLALPEEAIL